MFAPQINEYRKRVACMQSLSTPTKTDIHHSDSLHQTSTETSPVSLVSSHSTTLASVAMVSSTNIDSEVRTTVLPSVDITLTTVSPLTVDGVRDNEKVANDVETNLMGTVGEEVTETVISSTAPEIPDPSHHNTVMGQTTTNIRSQQYDSTPRNNLNIPAEIEEEQSVRENIPQLNVDVDDLIPSLQDEGLGQIKREISYILFQPNNIKFLHLYFLSEARCRCSRR